MNNLDKLEKIFPEVITESQDADGNLIRAVDFERLKQILSGNLAEGREAISSARKKLNSKRTSRLIKRYVR